MESTENTISLLTIRISHPTTSQEIGTGAIYYNPSLQDQVYILTAAHNLYEDGEFEKTKYESLGLEILNPKTNRYTRITYNTDGALINADPSQDLAVLTLQKEVVESILGTVPNLEALKIRGSLTNFAVKGFPQATDGKELVTIYPTWNQAMSGSNRFQIQIHEDYDGYSILGFSGAGVFAQTGDTLYLLGILTRARMEGQGNIAYCEYLDNFNELLQKHFRSPIPFSYIGNHHVSKSFFEKQLLLAIKNLGPRFNEELNFQLPIAHRFSDLAKDAYFKKRLLARFDRWLQDKTYNQTGNKKIADIEDQYSRLLIYGSEKLNSISWQANQSIVLTALLEQIEKLDRSIDAKYSELYQLQRDEMSIQTIKEKKHYTYNPPYQYEINRLRAIEKNNDTFVNELGDVNFDLVNHKCLLLQGDAGCGKSHLFGDIAKSRTERGLPTILLLGQLFKKEEDPWSQVLSQLGLDCNKNQFLQALDLIGQQIGSRVLILLDAINEGAGKKIWPDQLAGFLSEISLYPFIGIAVSVRTTYYESIISDNIKTDASIVKLHHQGFKGNEYEALRKFCDHFELKQPTFPILAPEFSNPLFLQITCRSLSQNGEKVFPKGFQSISTIFSYHLKAISKSLSLKREEYTAALNIAQSAIEALAEQMLKNPDSKAIPFEDASLILEKQFLKYPSLLADLIHENLLIQSSYRDNKTGVTTEVIYFTYERFGDFCMTKQLLSPYLTSEEILSAFLPENPLGKMVEDLFCYQAGMGEVLAILLPEKWDIEVFEICKWAYGSPENHHHDNIAYWVDIAMVESIKWRTVESIDAEKLIAWFGGQYFTMDSHQLFNHVLELAAVEDHPLNNDRTTQRLLTRSMADRDGFLQNFYRRYLISNGKGSASPMRRLIDWAWQPSISEKISDEIARLAGQTLSWALSSTDSSLRDQATKAMVNLLEQRPVALLSVLETFIKVNDPFIAERLYGIAYGCILRTRSIQDVESIAQTVYKQLFDGRNPPENLLLRDYGRNIIEYAIFRKANIDVDINQARPPYKSGVPKDIPSEDDLKAYRIEQKPGAQEKTRIRVYNSIDFNIMRWDFGNKIVDYKFAGFSPVQFTLKREISSFKKTLSKNNRKLIGNLEAFYQIVQLLSMSRPKRIRESLVSLESAERQIEDILIKLKNGLPEGQMERVEKEFIPYFKAIANENKNWSRGDFDTRPIKRWLVKRAHDCGYSMDLHGEYDALVDGYYRSEDVNTIADKYCWIALSEALAKIADNHKYVINEYSGKRFDYLNGPWQMYYRDINAAATTVDYDDEDDEEEEISELTAVAQSPWYKNFPYNHWKTDDAQWIHTIQDLPKPFKLLEQKDENGTSWIYLNFFNIWKEPRPIGKKEIFDGTKEFWYRIEGILYKKTQVKKLRTWFSNARFDGGKIPMSSHASTDIMSREIYWSPCYKQEPLSVWENVEDTTLKIAIASIEAVGELSHDKSGAHRRYHVPCLPIFKGMNLAYGDKDGDLVTPDGILAARYYHRPGLLMRKDLLLDFLDKNGLGIAWCMMGEKNILLDWDPSREFVTRSTLSGHIYIEGGEMKGEYSIVKQS